GLAHALALAGGAGDGRVRGDGWAVAGLPGRALPVRHPGRLGRGLRVGGSGLPAGVPARPAAVAARLKAQSSTRTRLRPSLLARYRAASAAAISAVRLSR